MGTHKIDHAFQETSLGGTGTWMSQTSSGQQWCPAPQPLRGGSHLHTSPEWPSRRVYSSTTWLKLVAGVGRGRRSTENRCSNAFLLDGHVWPVTASAFRTCLSRKKTKVPGSCSEGLCFLKPSLAERGPNKNAHTVALAFRADRNYPFQTVFVFLI